MSPSLDAAPSHDAAEDVAVTLGGRLRRSDSVALPLRSNEPADLFDTINWPHALRRGGRNEDTCTCGWSPFNHIGEPVGTIPAHIADMTQWRAEVDRELARA